MIERVNSYRTTDGSLYNTVEQAQQHELERLLEEALKTTDTEKDSETILTPISKFFRDNSEQVIDVLTTTNSSRPAARKLHGGSKKRKTENN